MLICLWLVFIDLSFKVWRIVFDCLQLDECFFLVLFFGVKYVLGILWLIYRVLNCLFVFIVKEKFFKLVLLDKMVKLVKIVCGKVKVCNQFNLLEWLKKSKNIWLKCIKQLSCLNYLNCLNKFVGYIWIKGIY